MGILNHIFGNGQSNESESVKRRKSLRNRLCRIEEVEPREMLSATPYEAPDAINIGAVYHEDYDLSGSGLWEDQGGDTFVVSWNGGADGTSLKQIEIDLDHHRVDGEFLYFNVGDNQYSQPKNGAPCPFTVLGDSDIGIAGYEVSDDLQRLIIYFNEDFTAGKQFKFKIDVNLWQNGQTVPVVGGGHFSEVSFKATFSSENYEDLCYETRYQDHFSDPKDFNLNVPSDEWFDDGDNSRAAMTAGFAEQVDRLQIPKPGSISGYVYEDVNNNGLKEAGENGIANVDLELFVWDGQKYVSTGLTTQTDENGFYEFNDVEGGKTYRVVETQPERYADGKDTVGTIGGDKVGVSDKSDWLSGIHLGANENGINYNFGELKRASISGYVYHDRNNDGNRDLGDEGIASVTVKLQVYDAVSGKYVDVDGKITTTDSNGKYEFNDLDPFQTYRVVEYQPDGWKDGRDTVGTIGGIKVGAANENDRIEGILLGYDEHGVEYNFGEYKPGSLSGHVYEDDNNNGVRDPNEKGIPGVEIWLCVVDENGNKINIEKTVTDKDGYYEFTNLEPGKTYCVTETDPSGYCNGEINVGDLGGDKIEQIAPGKDQIHNIVLGSGQNGTNYNFGENLRGSLSGYVYEDQNENGLKEAGEKGIGGVVLTLWVWDGEKYIQTSKTATTDEHGYYEFLGLCPFNKYRITEAQPEDYLDGQDSVGTIDGRPIGTRPDNDIISDILLPPGGKGVDYNFGELEKPVVPPPKEGSLSGYVYVDQNKNGVKNGNEPGIPAVTLTLWKLVNGKYVNTGKTATTNAEGYYIFNNLDPNETYMIVETQPTAYDDGQETVGSLGGDKSVNDRIQGIVLGSGQHGTNYNFGELEKTVEPTPDKGSLSGYVYVDANKNGSKDSGEKGIANTTLTLWKRVNGSYVKVAETTTDSNGYYIFANLDPNETYMIVETQPTAYDDGAETVGSLGGDKSVNDKIQGIALGSGQHGTNYNFGELEKSVEPTPDKGSLSGYVYVDANKNGSKDSGEKGISGVTLSLWKLVNGKYVDSGKTVTTDSNGYYIFSNLDPNETYMIVETQPTAYDDGAETVGSLGGDKSVNDKIHGIALGSGQHGTNYNFGELEKSKTPDPDPDPLPNTPIVPGIVTPGRPAGNGGNPGVGGALPSWQAPTLSEGLRTGYGGGGLPTGYSWHLSVVNAGYPRGSDAAEAAAQGLYAADAAAQRTMILDNGADLDADAKTRYVSVNWAPLPMNQSVWYVRDKDGNVSRRYVFGPDGGTPLAADFNGDGLAQLAVYHNGQWYIDLNGNGKWDEADLWAELGSSADQPIVGDWDGDGKADIGIFGPQWIGDPEVIAQEPGLPSDLNAATTVRPKNIPPAIGINSDGTNARAMKHSNSGQVRLDVIDHVFQYGGEGDKAFVGDFSGDGVKKVGVYRNGYWYIDYNGNGQWDSEDVFVDSSEQLRGLSSGEKAIPVIGDWDGDGVDNIGLFVNGVWHLDTTGNFEFDTKIEFGQAGDMPVVGDFSGDGIDQLAVYRPSDLDAQFTQSTPRQAPAVSFGDASPLYAGNAAPEAATADSAQKIASPFAKSLDDPATVDQGTLPEKLQRHGRTQTTPFTDVPLNR